MPHLLNILNSKKQEMLTQFCGVKADAFDQHRFVVSKIPKAFATPRFCRRNGIILETSYDLKSGAANYHFANTYTDESLWIEYTGPRQTRLTFLNPDGYSLTADFRSNHIALESDEYDNTRTLQTYAYPDQIKTNHTINGNPILTALALMENDHIWIRERPVSQHARTGLLAKGVASFFNLIQR